MSSFTLTLNLVYSLISDVDEYGSSRLTRVEIDATSGKKYFLTIFPTTGLPVADDVQYVISVSPVATYSQTLYKQIVFYQIYQSPSGTEMMFTQVTEATPISFSVSKSLLYVFYNNRSYPLLFQCPYTNVTKCKEAILNLFTFPSTIFMLYGNLFIHYSYIDTAYHAAFMGMYVPCKEAMIIRNLVDYNKTLLLLEEGNPVLYWNSNTFSVGNQVPYISYTPSMASSAIQTTIVTGFVNNYIVQNTSDVDIHRFAVTSRNDSVNINQDISDAISYTVLARAVPLRVPPLAAQNYSRFYLTGFGGLDYNGNQNLYAAIQILNILNSNNVYVTQSAPVVTTSSKFMLTNYNDIFYYKFDQINFILTVWVASNPAVPSFYDYLASAAGTIMTSDMTQLTDAEIQQQLYNNTDSQPMGAISASSVKSAASTVKSSSTASAAKTTVSNTNIATAAKTTASTTSADSALATSLQKAVGDQSNATNALTKANDANSLLSSTITSTIVPVKSVTQTTSTPVSLKSGSVMSVSGSDLLSSGSLSSSGTSSGGISLSMGAETTPTVTTASLINSVQTTLLELKAGNITKETAAAYALQQATNAKEMYETIHQVASTANNLASTANNLTASFKTSANEHLQKAQTNYDTVLANSTTYTGAGDKALATQDQVDRATTQLDTAKNISSGATTLNNTAQALYTKTLQIKSKTASLLTASRQLVDKAQNSNISPTNVFNSIINTVKDALDNLLPLVQ